MTLRLFINVAIGGILSLPPQVAIVRAQGSLFSQSERPKSSRVISQAGYNRALDNLFPREIHSPGETGITAYALILRFKPSFKPESQIVIRRKSDGVEVVEYTSLDGDIHAKLNEALSRTGDENTAIEMAKLIKVRRRVLVVPYSRVKQWHVNFLDSIGGSLQSFKRRSQQFDKDGTLDIFLDGTFYDLWYDQGVDRVSFSLYDEEIDDQRATGDSKIVRWMNGVRLEIARLGR